MLSQKKNLPFVYIRLMLSLPSAHIVHLLPLALSVNTSTPQSDMKPTVSLCFALLVSFVAADFTWWVDSTCDNSFPPGVFDKIMSEVPVTAQMVS
jgi:hypothetical protein